MSHIPVNHHLRPLYRVVAALTAGWLLVFGAVGLTRTPDGEWFTRGDWTALGLPTNRAFAVASLAAGAVVLLAALVGRNVDRFVNLVGGGAFLVAGTVMMMLTNTDANVLNFSIDTSVASYLVGLLLLTAGLYGKVGPARAAADGAGSVGEPAAAEGTRPGH
jgi:hypothetical protein